MAKKQQKGMGKVLFVVGVLIALIMGIGAAMETGWASNPWLVLLLVVLGLVVGFFNIAASEVSAFLTGTVGLILATAVANLVSIDTLVRGVGTFIQASLGNFIILIGAAAVVVSFKAVYSLAK